MIGLLTARLVVLVSLMTSADVAERHARRVAVPPNVVVPAAVRSELEAAVARSATLQRQMSIIGGAVARVRLRVSAASLSDSRRAESILNVFHSGLLVADVSVPPGPSFVELVAHELEHVVEQIEGVDRAALARTGAAFWSGTGAFETRRARDAGRAAAAEVEGRGAVHLRTAP